MFANLVATTQDIQPFSPRQIAAFFFKPVLDEEGDITGYHACKACGKRLKHAPRNGYTNLVTHVRTSHPWFESEMRDATAAATGTLVPWVSQKASNCYAWLKWVVEGNLPLTFCESKETRKNTNLAPVSVSTLVSNMEDVTKAVERSTGEEIPDELGLCSMAGATGRSTSWPSPRATTAPTDPATHFCPWLQLWRSRKSRTISSPRMGTCLLLSGFYHFFGKTI
ncbi:unnamed protein product [Phytophthora lilii]|uniref:Unnamed protein product n=1 Tax=Phytophthora lilii TaxID=2077276 RepID=A0A9W6YIY7_9STRA|nr:unnamed protein product [Phytophthora lilii]